LSWIFACQPVEPSATSTICGARWWCSRRAAHIDDIYDLGIFWVGQQTQLNYLARSDRSLSWIHIAFLFCVSVTPFSTTLLAEYPGYRVRTSGLLD